MSQRVLSTQAAHDAIHQIQAILSGDFENTLRKLDAQGTVLSDANNWDGPLASEFRSNVWPQLSRSLEQTRQHLDDLRNRVQTINQNIMQAGGNA